MKIGYVFVFAILAFAILAFGAPVMAQAATPATATPVPSVVGTPAPSDVTTTVPPPVTQPVATDYWVDLLFGLIVTVPGFTALGVVIVNVLKIPGWVTDGSATLWQNILSVLFAILIGCLIHFFPNVSIPALDVKFGQLAQTLTALLPIFAILYSWLAPILHNAIRGFPFLGHSNSVQLSLGVKPKV